MKLIGEVGFNRDDARKEFGEDDKVVRVCRFTEEGRVKVGFSFELGGEGR